MIVVSNDSVKLFTVFKHSEMSYEFAESLLDKIGISMTEFKEGHKSVAKSRFV